MALGSGKQNAISMAAQEATALIGLLGSLTETNVLFNGAPAYLSGITQADLDEVIGFASNGLTIQELTDGMYALGIIKAAIENALPALEGLKKLR